MANSESGMSTSNRLGGEYQVFLNFCGPDTRRGFTNSLYHALINAGISVFIDKEELPRGEIFSSNLLRAIDSSKFYIAIFSPSYASHHWCLRELAKMVENTSKPQGDGNKKVILPIFYNVKPNDVKLKTCKYSNAISELEKMMEDKEKKFSTKEVETWRRALKNADAIQGWELEEYEGDGHLSKSVVDEVLHRLWIKRRIVTKDLVGMKDRVAIINNLLGIDSSGECQVYLSFSRADTRRGFTNTLYHALDGAGIHVSIENEELGKGETISDSLLRAIDDSNFYIPIFSRNYALSHWCLKELERMVENTFKSKEDGDKKVILPIFYDVGPADVRLKTKLYRDAILSLEKSHSSKDVEAWRHALREVGGIRGQDLKNSTGDGHLSKSVVNDVVDWLQKKRSEIEDRLQKERSKDVRLVGIYGMTGIGKSTLAKIIFNQQYPRFGKYCSFLDDISKTAKAKGLVKLQKELLSNMSNSRVARNIGKIDYGIDMIGETICNKQVLIVLDDVDDVNQIQELIGMKALCPGTRILVTTRDKRVLKIRGFKYEILHYEMERLSDEDALQLFSRHAFDDYPPPDNYDTLSKNIVSTTGGLPLALEAIGSSLFLQKEQKIWEEKLEQLRKTPNRDVLGKLRISFDALEMDQQQIFLDIACSFIDKKKADAIYLWRDRGFSPEDAIDVLISRCMIKVTNDHRFWMHDQYKDFGKAIANQERSRLWARDDIICESKSTKIKGSVQGLRLQSDLSTQPPITVTTESYREKILNQPIQGSGSKTEAGDPLLKTNQQNKEKRRKIETESAKEQGEINQGESL